MKTSACHSSRRSQWGTKPFPLMGEENIIFAWICHIKMFIGASYGKNMILISNPTKGYLDFVWSRHHKWWRWIPHDISSWDFRDSWCKIPARNILRNSLHMKIHLPHLRCLLHITKSGCLFGWILDRCNAKVITPPDTHFTFRCTYIRGSDFRFKFIPIK